MPLGLPLIKDVIMVASHPPGLKPVSYAELFHDPDGGSLYIAVHTEVEEDLLYCRIRSAVGLDPTGLRLALFIADAMATGKVAEHPESTYFLLGVKATASHPLLDELIAEVDYQREIGKEEPPTIYDLLDVLDKIYSESGIIEWPGKSREEAQRMMELLNRGPRKMVFEGWEL